MKFNLKRRVVAGVMSAALAMGLMPTFASAAPSENATGAATESTIDLSLTAQADDKTSEYGATNIALNPGTYTLYGAYATLGMVGLRTESKYEEPTLTITKSDEGTISGVFKFALNSDRYSHIAYAENNKVNDKKELSSDSASYPGTKVLDSNNKIVAWRFETPLTEEQIRSALGDGLPFVVKYDDEYSNSSYAGTWYTPSKQQAEFKFDALDIAPVKLNPTSLNQRFSGASLMFSIASAQVSREVPEGKGYKEATHKLVLQYSPSKGAPYKGIYLGTIQEYLADKEGMAACIGDASPYSYELPVSFPMTTTGKDGAPKDMNLLESTFKSQLVIIDSSNSIASNRQATLDLVEGTITFDNADNSYNVAVKGLEGAKAQATLDVYGYAKPKPSLDLEQKLTLTFDQEIFDKAEIKTYTSGKFGEEEYDPSANDPIDIVTEAATEKGTLVLPLRILYKKANQLSTDGTQANIRLHVSKDSGFKEADTWVNYVVEVSYDEDTYLPTHVTFTPAVDLTMTKIAPPVPVTGLVYNGKAQTGVKAGTGYAVSGTSSATNAGTYSATAIPEVGYVWADGTTEAKTIKWTIAAAAQKITAKTLSKTFKKAKVAKKAQSFKMGAQASGKGKLSYKVVKKHKKITFKNGKITVKKGTKKGKYNIKVRVTAKAIANYAAATKDFTIKVKVK